MAQEVRSILFAADEIHTAVTDMLVARIRGLKAHQIERVTVQYRDGIVRASVRFGKELDATRLLDPNELMSAILMYCRKSRIPLSSRSQKKLSVIEGCVSLTTALNMRRIDPWVEGDTVIHAVAHPELAALHRS